MYRSGRRKTRWVLIGLTLAFSRPSPGELIIASLIAIGFYYFCAKQGRISCCQSSRSFNYRFRFPLVSQLNRMNEQRKCYHLRQQLSKRVPISTADRLVDYEKIQYPGKTESWYLDKVLYDLTRGR